MDDWRNIRSMQSCIYGNLEIMMIWIMEGMREPIPEMIEIMNEHIPRKIHPLLFLKYDLSSFMEPHAFGTFGTKCFLLIAIFFIDNTFIKSKKQESKMISRREFIKAAAAGAVGATALGVSGRMFQEVIRSQF